MGIAEGKSLLYTAAAGVDPSAILPVCIDVGTANPTLLNDPSYKGLRQPRLTGAAYEAVIEEFITALKTWQPHVVLQFEDFANHTAFHLLHKYRTEICSFNDDVQGTACITLAGLLSALRAEGARLKDQRVLVLGAGEAGVGIGELIAIALEMKHGMTRKEARKQCYFMDSKGLVCASRKNLQSHKLAFAHDVAHCSTLEEAVSTIKPTVLIGVSTSRGAFTPEIMRTMATLNKRPIIFPLSNPTSKSECTFEEAFAATDGRVLFASGSPFPPIAHQGKTYTPAQANNAYVFPAIGHAAALCNAKEITDEVFLLAAEALAGMTTKEDFESGMLFPRFANIRTVSCALMAAIADDMCKCGLGKVPADFDSVVAKMKPTTGRGAVVSSRRAKWEVYSRAHMYDPSMPSSPKL
jgi:malate dehydrogenase (oxaloacetate-decarboxylating)(NADP+)